MINIEYEKYTIKYNRALNKTNKQQKEYLKKHGFSGNFEISSIEHPKYFEIDKKFEKIKNELNAPILAKAYYKIGDELVFVKKNTYSHKDESKPHLLLDKVNQSITYFFVKEEYEKYIKDNPNLIVNGNEVRGCPIYYENVICKGIVSEVMVSHSGSGQIMYRFEEINPPCYENNGTASVLEKHVITKI